MSGQGSGSAPGNFVEAEKGATAANAFTRSWRLKETDEEEEIRCAALESLTTFERMRRVEETETVVAHQKTDNILKLVEEDNEKFLGRIRERIDRVGIEIPKIEVRYENLCVEGDAYTGSRALPTLINATINSIEAILGLERLAPSKKTAVKILHELNGIVKSSRMTLLLGPPGAGKTTFLLALANQLNKNLRVKGNVTYCGLEFSEFIPQRTCAYISQHDLHFGEMTVRETLEFSARCLGVGNRHELLGQILRREKEEGILPDPVIDAFTKATAIQGHETNLVTDYFLKMLGIDICADTVIGDQMRRGISGGQKKRVTIGEMLVGPAKVLLMDEISTGLDASTTYQICKFLRLMVHLMDLTCIISLLQPAPETYELFDDVILMSEGQIVYQGPRQNVLEFFKSMGFRCPERKGVADFLLEVTSRKDQAQYWIRENQAYRFVSVTELSEAFKSFHIGQQVTSDMKVPYERCKAHQSALAQQTYGLSNWELFSVCFSRELLLMKRNSFIYTFKAIQITIISLMTMTVYLRTTMHHHTITDGEKYLGALFFSMVNATFNNMAEMALTVFKIPVLHKQRDFLFYPAWAYALPVWVLGIPLSFMESGIWVVLTYHSIGFAPAPSRFFRQFLAFFGIHQMALPLFRLVAALGRTLVVSNMVMFFTLLSAFAVGGYIIAREDIPSWLSWAYYASPIMYGQTAVAINEFLDERWSMPNQDPLIDQPTIGKCVLASRGFFVEEYWYWICIGALLGFSLLFNVLFILALTYLNPYVDLKSLVPDENYENVKPTTPQILESSSGTERGMILPFQPLTLAFNNVNYYVDVPPELKAKGFEDDRLQLLRGVSGSFRPGILTALVGVSGAGKTTLMDVLAGRKTTGYIEGSIKISGYPKKHETFARISGYCEQTDVHSPCVTVYESLLFSAWLRLPSDINASTRKTITEEVMELIELKSLGNALIGLPGVDGLTTEQRKRLTIAVELVANPSIIFMDEPTSGLDARAAAIVMRTIRNTVNTGRTVVCTIHQPSIDIFEAFDELLLMKRGGQVIYAGPRGYHSHTLIKYFEAVCGVPKIKDGYNPATWMLDITDPHFEAQLNVDFAEIYVNSNICRENQELITKLSCPSSDSRDLYFPTKYSRSFISQCKACFWKQYLSYWRNAPYNVVRFLTTIVIGVLFGLIFWKQGGKVAKMQDIMNLTGFLYMATLFLGSGNAATIQPVIAIERAVLNRERAAGMYSALAYAIAQVEVEAIYIVIQSSIYTILLYSMIGFEWAILKFLYFYYFIFMCFLYFTIYGMMLVALTPGEEIGAIVMVFFVSFWNLFAGFLIARPEIPIWWRWYYWASPISWTLYGLLTSQFGDNNAPLTVPGGGGTTVKNFLKDYFGFDQKFLPIVVIAHLGWVMLFLFVFAYAIKYLNFQRR